MNILIVEDNIIISMDLQYIIKKTKHTLIGTANNYDKAVFIALNTVCDLIFMDVNLGKNSKTGIDAAREIYKSKRPKIVYLTAQDDFETIQKMLQTSPCSLITKPFTPKDILNIINQFEQ